MKDCPTILFGDLDDVIPNQINAVVWRRKYIADSLNLSESQFIELALLVGNDFTSEMNWNEFDNVPSQSSTIGEIIDFIQSQSPDYQVTSPYYQTNLILQFSRDFYQLNDLTIYPDDESVAEDINQEENSEESEDNDSDDGDNDNTHKYLGLNRKNCLRSYFGKLTHIDKQFIYETIESLSFNSENNFPELIFSMLKEKSNKDTEKEDDDEVYLSSTAALLITPQYSQMIQNMTQTTKLEYLNQEIIENKPTKKQKKKTKKAEGDLLDEEKRHSWEDIVVLDQFECLLKQIHRVLFRKLTPNLSKSFLVLLKIFHNLNS